MSDLFDRIVSVIAGTLTQFGLRESNRIYDYAIVRFWGLSFVVLGARQTGKTTLIEWLRGNSSFLNDFAPEPTRPGGERVQKFSSRVAGETIRTKIERDVSGEEEAWEQDWVDLLTSTKPRGIIFLIDYKHPEVQSPDQASPSSIHKEAFDYVLNLLQQYPDVNHRLKAFYVFVNKSDIWGETTISDILKDYRNQRDRLEMEAERTGYSTVIAGGSITSGEGINSFMKSFFNAIRPRPKE